MTPSNATQQASLSIINFPSFLKLMSIQLVMPSNHLMLCHSHLLLPLIFLSIRVFSSESVLCIRWPNYWSFSFHISLIASWSERCLKWLHVFFFFNLPKLDSWPRMWSILENVPCAREKKMKSMFLGEMQLHFHFSLSYISEGNGNPLQCSCLENPSDGGAWWAAVYGVTQSWTWLKRLSSSSSSPVDIN